MARPATTIWGWTGRLLVVLAVLAATLVSAAALYLTVERSPWNLLLALLLGAAGVACAITQLLGRAMRPAGLAFLAGCVGTFLWWSTIVPSHQRQWQTDVARLPRATIDGERITLHDIRNFDYRSETDYTPAYYDKTVDLGSLDSIDLIAVHWGSDAIAHIMLSFGFGDERIAFSIEIRKEVGEAYSPIKGFFRQYELIYIVGDERDLVRLRTNYRRPAEDVYIYRTRMRPDRLPELFLEYLRKINELYEKPEFYNTLTTNCTTALFTNARAINDRLPTNWKVLLSGYFPEYVYDLGALSQERPFAELKAISRINAKAEAADQAPDFSARIREGLPEAPPLPPS